MWIGSPLNCDMLAGDEDEQLSGTADSSRTPAGRRLTTSGRVAAIAYAVLALLTLQSSLRATAWDATASPALRQGLRQLLPEGWSFFTLSPRTSQLRAATYDPNSRRFVPTAHHPSTVAPIPSASRLRRLRSIELGILTATYGPDDWTVCRIEPADCAKKLQSRPHTLSNRESPLCGRVLIQRATPRPWAWSEPGVQPVTGPIEVILLNVRCGKNS